MSTPPSPVCTASSPRHPAPVRRLLHAACAFALTFQLVGADAQAAGAAAPPASAKDAGKGSAKRGG